MSRSHNPGLSTSTPIPAGSRRRLRRRLPACLIAALVYAGAIIAIHAAPGDLDPTFGNGGIVTTNLSEGADWGWDVLLQPDGKIVVGGGAASDFALVRYDESGGLDPSFDGDGVVTTDIDGLRNYVTKVAGRDDGRIVAVGTLRVEEGTDFAIAQYTPDGVLDETFGAGGIVKGDLGVWDGITSLAIQQDGKLIIGGTPGVSLFSYDDVVLQRYHLDGTLDSSFGTGGTVITKVGYGVGATRLALQRDGKIVVVGDVYTQGIDSPLAIIRYNSDGQLDTTFGEGGIALVDFEAGAPQAIAIAGDGKIIVAGRSERGFTVARYTADGQADPTFGSDGIVGYGLEASGEGASAMALQRDGKILLACCDDVSTNSHWVLARLQVDGSLDPAFGANGVLYTDLPGVGYDRVGALALQWDGRIIVAGDVEIGDWDSAFVVARYEGGPAPMLNHHVRVPVLRID